MRQKEDMCLKILVCRHTYGSCTCVSGITYNLLKFEKNCTSIIPFLRRIKSWNMSPKRTGNTLSCSLLMYLPQKFPADAEYALRASPRVAARGTALRAVKVLTSCQILPEPLECAMTHFSVFNIRLEALLWTHAPAVVLFRSFSIASRKMSASGTPTNVAFLPLHTHLFTAFSSAWLSNIPR